MSAAHMRQVVGWPSCRPMARLGHSATARRADAKPACMARGGGACRHPRLGDAQAWRRTGSDFLGVGDLFRTVTFLFSASSPSFLLFSARSLQMEESWIKLGGIPPALPLLNWLPSQSGANRTFRADFTRERRSCLGEARWQAPLTPVDLSRAMVANQNSIPSSEGGRCLAAAG